ncbi:MAG: ribose-phosphate diphosphokinase [Pseudomonadota bacterium]
MSAVVQAFAADQAGAARLADALGLELETVRLHVFPDREVLPTVTPFAGVVIAYCPLNQPNAKLMSLILACDAWRRAGATRLVLVAPYMCYLRQDTLFAPGQALSRDVIGRLLGERFDRIVTVEPHLHRTTDLGAVFAPAQVTALSAAEPLARAIGADPPPVVIGPDGESEPWARAIGEALGAPHMTLRKTRHGDHRVDLSLEGGPDLKGRRAVIIDDICSSGGTLEAAVALALAQGAERVEVAVVHALFDWATARRLAEAGASRIISTDSCPHPSNAVALAPILAAALTEEIST